MRVWRIKEKGSDQALYVEKLAEYEELSGGRAYEERGAEYIIRAMEMSRRKFENLPEFDGW